MTEEKERSEAGFKDFEAETLSKVSDILESVSVFTSSETIGDQTLSYADSRIRVEDAAHKRQVEKQRLDHELAQEKDDKDFQRWREKVTFIAILGILVIGLIAGFTIATVPNDSDTRRWGQGIVTLLLGGVVGGVAGYMTGSKNK